MRVLAACSLGGAGHLGPLRPFLDAARARGDETVVVAPPAMAAMVAATGHDFIPGGEPPEAAIAPIRERLPRVDPGDAAVLGNRELFGRLAATAMLSPVAVAVERWRPDLVLRDPCEYASAAVAATVGVPVAQIAISLAEAEWSSIAVAAPALEELRPDLTGIVRATPYVTRFPAPLDPSPFPATVRVREENPTPQPLPAWWGGDDRPLVYVTFGTVVSHMTAAAAIFGIALDALAGLDARVLLTVGPAFDPERLGPVPDGMHVERWVDQADVLPEASAVVGHGGSGTTFGALAAGVPLVVVPVFGDQFVNAQRVAEVGAGIAVLTQTDDGGRRRPLATTDAPRLRAALDAVLHDATYRRAARRVARDMDDAPSPGTVLDRLANGCTRR